MEMPGKVAMPETADESTESVVLQCTSSGDVEDGEEVVRSEPASERVMFVPTSTLGPKRFAVKMLASRGREWEEDVVVRSSGVRAWLMDDSAYWNTGGRVRTRRNKETKGHVEDVGETFVVEKRKLEESKECGRLSESELDEGTDSDAESAASSSSDSEEEISWRANKRRRAGEEVHESRRGRPSMRAQSAQEESNCDNELKEMQLLLELQLKASERREAGMKQRMETMMALMSRHMGHVEKRVSTLDVAVQPQEKILERINVKLEKVMEGFTTLNENLSILSACLSRDFESQ